MLSSTLSDEKPDRLEMVENFDPKLLTKYEDRSNSNVERVPMTWSRNTSREENVERGVTALSNEGLCKNVFCHFLFTRPTKPDNFLRYVKIIYDRSIFKIQ